MKSFRKSVYLAVAGATLGMVAAAPVLGAEALTVVSWGGASQENMRHTWFEPYSQMTGVKIVEDTWNGELGKLRSMVEAGQVSWDVGSTRHED